MFSNPLTSIFGLAVIVLKVLAAYKPDLAPVIADLLEYLIGGGFIAAADGTKGKLSTGLRSVLWAVGFALILSAMVAPAHAQTVTVDLNKASLAWDWTKATPPATNTGDVERFDAKCGRLSGVYSSTTPINDPAARSVKIASIVNNTGQWFCVIVAVNRYAPSGPSNEVSFDAGAAPADPKNNRLQAQ